MSKRGASSDLNHDNWDQEEEPENAGSFTKAPDSIIKNRVIKVAKRRNAMRGENESGGVFSSFTGFSKTETPPVSAAFNFLSNLKPSESDSTKMNGNKPEKSDEYCSKLKGLNESVLSWIEKHVKSNPLINLQPIFKDYNKYFEELEEMDVDLKKSKESPVISESTEKSLFKFASSPNLSTIDNKNKNQLESTEKNPIFSFNAAPKSELNSSLASTVTFSFGDSQNQLFSSTSAPSFNFGMPSPPKSKIISKEVEESEEEPPKSEFTKVVEDGHIYSVRCKVFVKKDGSFGDRGVGNLYLKPVPDSNKYQLIVRADTNLGNLLCNFILSEGIPMQRMGKKDVMLVCLPTPETKPPPLPILLRVKTSEDADDLLKVLKQYQK